MKKIKKLTLNKEVVSILGGNDMNLVKGGVVYTDALGDSCGNCFLTFTCPAPADPAAGGGGGVVQGQTYEQTCTGCITKACGNSYGGTCNGDSCGNTCPITCPNTCAATCGATCKCVV